MMSTANRPGFSIVPRAVRAALQWRLLLLWAGCLLAPAVLMALPLWRLLGASFDYSVHAGALAHDVDMTAIADLATNFSRSGPAFPFAALVALALTLLLSPLLSGMAMSAARAPQPPGFDALIAGGLQDYPRMARMLVVALIPLGIAAGLGSMALRAASRYDETALLQSDSDAARLAAMLVLALLLALAHATLDAGRAALALDRRRRSALLAWRDGCKLLLRRPFATFGIYLAITLAGLALAALLSLGRIHLAPVSTAGLAGALALTQLIVMALAWMRTARLFAMVELARTLRPT
jgi:hypothetical protein